MIYEFRTYQIKTGSLQKVMSLFKDKIEGRNTISKLGAFWYTEIGHLNQIIHVWQFEDDNSRRALWKTIYADQDFLKFATEFRPLVLTQENKLMTAAPWTPILN